MATNTVQIFGNTYAVRAELKALGGRWNPQFKSWDVPEAQAASARAIVTAAPVEGSETINVPLGRHRTGAKNYAAQCPACARLGEDRRGSHLSVLKSDPAVYRCWQGCTPEDIKRALGLDSRCRIRFTK